jgi:uncharacterized protein YjiS (DUF1127 family)
MRQTFPQTRTASLWSAVGTATVPPGRGPARSPGRGFAWGVAAWLRRVGDTHRLWQGRGRGREQLLRLGEYELRDIGITRLQAEAEANKPFWRP